MNLIAPSTLSADFSKLGEEIRTVEKAGADWIHVDVMDGQFVPNITMGPLIVEAARKVTDLPLDVHLMIMEPVRFISDFVAAGASLISVHVESAVHLNRTIQLIKESGVKAGVVLNPATPLSVLEWILTDVDYVLLMSVNPGFGGQTFIPSCVEKITRLKSMIIQKGLDILVQIDGGVNESTVGAVNRAGADVLVAGSAIFGTDNYEASIASLRKKAAV